ncbi:MAG: hypothetical protein FWE09_02870 [Treponema sp.]|nr:hypothetical protein [Treponema sp.]
MGDKDVLSNPANVKFSDLLEICAKNFGSPRIRGSHHIFKMPWPGDPRINIQKDGNMAKAYQVKIVRRALARLASLERYEEENGNG